MLPVLQTEKGIDCSLFAFHSNLELSIDTHTHNCVKLSCLYQTTCLTHQRERESETPGEHTNSNQSEKFVQTVPSWIWRIRVLIVFLETWKLVYFFFWFQISCLDTFNTSGHMWRQSDTLDRWGSEWKQVRFLSLEWVYVWEDLDLVLFFQEMWGF